VRRLGRLILALACALTLAVAIPASANESGNDHDPWEGMNRKVFAFNDALDRWFLEPVAKGWDFIAPDLLQHSIDNVVQNARFPIDFANSLFQGKPRDSFDTLSRFILNTTFGMAGLFDPASQIGLAPPREDFGQTLAVWGVGAGPYVVLPALGPSTVRDTGGLTVDAFSQVWPWFTPFGVGFAHAAGDAINRRSLFLDELATAKAGAFDYYALIRNAYLQRREALIADRLDTEEEDEDELYYYDFDE